MKKTFAIGLLVFVALTIQAQEPFWLGADISGTTELEAKGKQLRNAKGEPRENTALMRKRHGIILEDRKNLTLTGVKDVSGFDEQKVILQTELGELTIKGGNLHINDFSHENGELNLDGKVDSLVYTEDKRTEGGFFARLLK